MKEKTAYELKEKLCKHLDELSERPLDDLALKHIHDLTDSIKNILKIEMLEEVGDEYYGERENSYNDGYSRARRGEHYVRGHYSRGKVYDDDIGHAYRRGRSYADGKDHVMRELENIMRMTNSEEDRDAIRRCMNQIEMA